VLEREKDIYRVRPARGGKPENLIEKILDGQINKFYGEICLLEQAYVIDPDQKVGKSGRGARQRAWRQGRANRLQPLPAWRRIEKKEDNFAAEVASMTR